MENKQWVDENATSPLAVIFDPDEFVKICDEVFRWGVARNITASGGATSLSQIKKLKEEVNELEEGLLEGNAEKISDGMGDVLVVLLQISRLSGLSLSAALAGAMAEIRHRKGKMIKGIFVKEADLVE